MGKKNSALLPSLGSAIVISLSFLFSLLSAHEKVNLRSDPLILYEIWQSCRNNKERKRREEKRERERNRERNKMVQLNDSYHSCMIIHWKVQRKDCCWVFFLCLLKETSEIKPSSHLFRKTPKYLSSF